MFNVLTVVGDLIIAGLSFAAEFVGSLCLIAIALIAFLILFIFLVGLCYVIATTLLEYASDKNTVFRKEVEDYDD